MRITPVVRPAAGALLALGLVAALSVATCPPALAEDAVAAPCPPPPPPPDPCGGSVCDPPPPGCPCPCDCVPAALFCIPCFDDCIAAFQKAKADSCFKLGAGAYHWFNYNFDTEKLNYGSPTAQGTYFYHVDADLECKTCNPCVSWGLHAQLRARDQSTFRSFIDHEVWFYELYGFVDFADYGTFKVGKVWKRFGLDWDGTFYGNVAYFDGHKLDPDFGVSWEKTWNEAGRVTLDTIAQYFWHEDGINGSIAGADPESTPSLTEEHTFVGRVLGTWKFRDNLSLAVGASAFTGTVTDNVSGGDDTASGWAVDARFRWCGLEVFGEVMQADGVLHPAHYVTNGPSDFRTDWLAGAQFKCGAFTPRVVFSHGDYENPGGSQDLLVVGGTIELTKWLTLYVEYVSWDVEDAGGTVTPFEDGLQVVLNWHV
jgi:hypothetical protein